MNVDLPRLWPRVEPILDAVLDLPEPRRSARVDALCAGDPELALAVAGLLRADRDSGGFLQAAPAEMFDLDQEAPAETDAGAGAERIGPFRITAELGSGGMGTVLLGERDDGQFEQKVAIKIFSTEIAPAAARETLVRERRILARLEHPNIARIFDGGVTDAGDPYFVMEFVDGRPIDEHCEAEHLGAVARLRLFLDVCRAVAYAHGRLVVHCDLKPRNILVTGAGDVKVVDFGISRRLEEVGHGLSRGDAKLMTPAYAAPEQIRGEPVTMATDVYQLGLVLFELLTARRARGAGASPDLELPPDLRLGADLDAIVRKALRSDPGERYTFVESMADDVRRHLNNEPVSARADTFAYRAAKFVRRNRGGVAAAGLVIAAVLAGIAGFAWQARQTRIQRDAARKQLARATATNEFMSFLLSAAAPGGGKFSVAELLEHGAAAVDKQYAHDDAMRTDLLVTIGEQYLEANSLDKATPILERARDIAAKGGDPALEARASCPLGLLRMLQGKRSEAEALVQRALAVLPEGELYAPQRAECLLVKAQFGFFTSEPEPMIRDAMAVIDLQGRTPNSSPMVRIYALNALAYGYYLSQQIRKSDEAYAQVLADLEAVGRGQTLGAADALNGWAILHFRGDIGKSERLARRVLELHRSIEGEGAVPAVATGVLAGILLRMGRDAEAEPLFEEALREARARKNERALSDFTIQLAELYIDRGELPRAEAQLDAVAALEKQASFGNFRRAQLTYTRGKLAQARGDDVSAKHLFQQAAVLYDGIESKIALNVLTLIGLARAERTLGDTSSAKVEVEKALALAASFVEKDEPSFLVGLSLVARGDLERAQESSDAARATYKAAWEHLNKTLGPNHPATKRAKEMSSS